MYILAVGYSDMELLVNPMLRPLGNPFKSYGEFVEKIINASKPNLC